MSEEVHSHPELRTGPHQESGMHACHIEGVHVHQDHEHYAKPLRGTHWNINGECRIFLDDEGKDHIDCDQHDLRKFDPYALTEEQERDAAMIQSGAASASPQIDPHKREVVDCPVVRWTRRPEDEVTVGICACGTAIAYLAPGYHIPSIPPMHRIVRTVENENSREDDFSEYVSLFKRAWAEASRKGMEGKRTAYALGKVCARMVKNDECFSHEHAAQEFSNLRSKPTTQNDSHKVSDGQWECDGCKDAPYLHHVNEEFHIRNAYGRVCTVDENCPVHGPIFHTATHFDDTDFENSGEQESSSVETHTETDTGDTEEPTGETESDSYGQSPTISYNIVVQALEHDPQGLAEKINKVIQEYNARRGNPRI